MLLLFVGRCVLSVVVRCLSFNCLVARCMLFAVCWFVGLLICCWCVLLVSFVGACCLLWAVCCVLFVLCCLLLCVVLLLFCCPLFVVRCWLLLLVSGVCGLLMFCGVAA